MSKRTYGSSYGSQDASVMEALVLLAVAILALMFNVFLAVLGWAAFFAGLSFFAGIFNGNFSEMLNSAVLGGQVGFILYIGAVILNLLGASSKNSF